MGKWLNWARLMPKLDFQKELHIQPSVFSTGLCMLSPGFVPGLKGFADGKHYYGL